MRPKATDVTTKSNRYHNRHNHPGYAKGASGDAGLWYLIADANGLAGNAEVRVGQVLTIPVGVASANNAGTFTPYGPSRIVHDDGPTLMRCPRMRAAAAAASGR